MRFDVVQWFRSRDTELLVWALGGAIIGSIMLSPLFSLQAETRQKNDK